ncbi:MAG: non-heme iron oxygenase ferredoxin subunit [Nocardioidaceae bacterium]|nr:non-heme iron oxygenase ferredoxin subunit [Nocardioidaceae bacterium]
MAFQRACGVADLVEGKPVAVEVDGVEVALVRCPEGVYAIQDECSHAAIALSEGEVEGCTLECWLHGSRFDLRTGSPIGLPATEPVPVYPVRLDADDVLVDVTTPALRAP